MTERKTPEEIAASHSLKASGNTFDYKNTWVVDAIKEYAQQETLLLQEELESWKKEASDNVYDASETIKALQTELTKAKERIKELEDIIRTLSTAAINKVESSLNNSGK